MDFAPIFHARPLPSSGFRFPKSGLRVPGFGKMRTPEFRRIGNSQARALRAGRHERAGGGQVYGMNQSPTKELCNEL